jgi:hypothetical protein
MTADKDHSKEKKMVDIAIHDEILDVYIQGIDKILTLTNHLEIPMEHVRFVQKGTASSEEWWYGLREPGVRLPQHVMAGTFYQHGKRVFYDVRNPDRSIIIDLDDDQFDQLIVEVASPYTVITEVQEALAAFNSS